MKRIPQVRVKATNTRDRMAAIIPQQAAHFASRARGSDRREIAAAGTTGWLYQRVTGGQVCTCGITSFQTILDDGGNLTPAAMNEIATEIKSSDRRLEVYVASDLDESVVDDPLPGNPSTSPVSDLPEIDLLGQEVNRCAVCFGSGFVPGYRLANGYRDAIVPSDVTETDYTVDEGSAPNVGRGGSFIEVPYTLPLKSVIFRVWDEDLVPHVVQPEPNYALGVLQTLHFEFDLDWTHIEVISFDAGIPVDFNQSHYEDATETEYAEADFSVPGDYRVGLQSVIVEDRTMRAWQVRTVTPTKDNTGATVFQQANARRIRPNELAALLMATGAPKSGAVAIAAGPPPDGHDELEWSRTDW